MPAMPTSTTKRMGLPLCVTLACGGGDPPGESASATSTGAVTSTGADASSSGEAAPTTTTEALPTTSGAQAGSTDAPGTTDAPASTGEASSTGAASSTGESATCRPGEITCEGEVAIVCDGPRGVPEQRTCPALCVPGLGCALCVPGEASCEGEVSRVCHDDGQRLEEVTCDPLQGLACDPDTGRCVGACAPDTLDASYIGCDYYPTVTPNVVDESFTFAVVVSNTSGLPATLTLTRGDALLKDFVVQAGAVEVVPLEWVAALKSPVASAVVADGAYRLRADQPVTVYQYSPLEYKQNAEFSYSNDASLLLPTHVWGRETRVIARNTFKNMPGSYTVVARRDGTAVEVTPSSTGGVVIPGGGVSAGGTGVVALDEGDVLVVISGVGGGVPDKADLTGTRVVADHPVQVIGGHACTNVPHDKTACDHLEEFNLPVENLAEAYFVTTPLIKPPGLPAAKKARMIRIVAAADEVALSYDPPQAGAPAFLAQAGDHAEFQSDQDFRVSASGKIAVAEYMLGQSAGGNSGDPALTIAIPHELFRTTYAVHAPIHYESNFVNLVAPAGVPVLLDDQMVPPALWTPVGATGWSSARVPLSSQGDGDHSLSAAQPFGVQVYGYGQYTSYWYPGGTNVSKPL